MPPNNKFGGGDGRVMKPTLANAANTLVPAYLALLSAASRFPEIRLW